MGKNPYWTGCVTSGGSMTRGVPAGRALSCVPTSSLKHLRLDTAAKMIAAWKVNLEEQVVIHEMRPNRRPYV